MGCIRELLCGKIVTAVVPTYVVGTTVHMTSLKISQFKYKKHLVWTLQEMREYPWAARLEFLELFLQLA